MGDWVSVPIGIDLGTTRIRLATGHKNRLGQVRLGVVVARDVPAGTIGADGIDDSATVAAILEDLLLEARSRERRCVLSIGPPAGALRYVRFPKMTWAERLRAARFEVERWPGFERNPVDLAIRVHPVLRDQRLYAVGATRAGMVKQLADVVKSAGLRAVGIDHHSCAYARILEADAVVDVGAESTAVYAFTPQGPAATLAELGGDHVTRAISRALSIDTHTAEKRKRILGCAGAGSEAADDLVASVTSVIERLRTRTPIERIALTGNGGRLPAFAQALREATGSIVEMTVPAILELSDYPADVIRAASPDWSLAASLLTWGAATA